MTKANTRILGSAIALSLVMGAAGTAHATLNLQGLNPQGLNPQGLNPQGLNPQGLNPQGISLDGVTLSGLTFLNGDVVTGTTLLGSGLITHKNGTQLSGGALIGSTFQATMTYTDGLTTATQQVTLYVADVKTDTNGNSMVCDPQNPGGPTDCVRNYNKNTDVNLYKLYYWVGDLADAPIIAPMCRGDQSAMFFKGTWDDDRGWISDTNKLTVSCTDGVLAKCARMWGYKPWRVLTDKHGNLQSMRNYHQACLRAASADYAGTGFPLTVTGTVIDMFDNGGFNLPASASDLTNHPLHFNATERFESYFTSDKMAGSIKPDYWGAWMSAPRYDPVGWGALYDYVIDWDGQFPKTQVFESYTPANMIAAMDGRYGLGSNFTYAYYGPELVVYNPTWSVVGSNLVPGGSTTDSFDHFTPPTSCAQNSNAPDRAHRWVAPQSGSYKITTLGSSYNTVLYAYQNHALGPCNNDSNGTQQSVILVNVTAGEEITLIVDGNGTAGGNYVLNITKQP